MVIRRQKGKRKEAEKKKIGNKKAAGMLIAVTIVYLSIQSLDPPTDDAYLTVKNKMLKKRKQGMGKEKRMQNVPPDLTCYISHRQQQEHGMRVGGMCFILFLQQ
jgi:hypothetical protein